MKDRIPTYPGRIKLTPVSGQTNTYDMTRADEPLQEGTPLNKNTLLRDATAEALGLTADATVDEALGRLTSIDVKVVTGTYTGTGKYGVNNPTNLSLPFVPKVVIVFGGVQICTFTAEMVGLTYGMPASMNSLGVLTAFGTTVAWYTTESNANSQLNASGTLYKYVAIG